MIIASKISIFHLLAAFLFCFAGLSQGAQANNQNPSVVTYLNASEARDLLAQNPDIVVLDVRTKGEYKKGHIEGAIRNNYFSTKFKKRLRVLDKNTPYLVHCKSGHCSNRAVKIMRKQGFTQIIHLDGGYDAWKKLGAVKTD